MLTLFETRTVGYRGTHTHPEFSYIKAGLRREVAKFQRYYRQNALVVRSSHLIVQLLQSLHVSPHLDIATYVSQVADQATRMAMAFKLTTPTVMGKLHDGVFYGKGMREAIILTTTPFDQQRAAVAWNTLSPLRVVSHPFTHLGMWVPDGLSEGDEVEGYAVIELNLPMLAVQYRQWLALRSLTPEVITTATLLQFVHRFPLTNLIESHLDHSVLNRAAGLSQGARVSQVKVGNPFYVVDYQRHFDRVVYRLMKDLERRRLTFPVLLEQLPSVSQSSAYDTVRLPMLAKTRQVDWALTLSRLRTLAFLVQYNDRSQTDDNRQWLNRIRRGVQQLENDRLFTNTLPRPNTVAIHQYLDNEIKPFL